MRRSTRQPASLVPKGLICNDEHLVLIVRMAARLTNGQHQEVGPLLRCHVPWSMVYDTEIGDWLNSEHAKRLALFDRQQAEENARAQAPLF